MAQEGHDHVLHGRRDAITTVALLALAAVDLAAGLLFTNPAIVAEAGHNAFDALFTLTTGLLKRWTRNRQSHWLQDHLPAVVGIVICVTTVVAISALTVLECLKPINVTFTAAGVTAALGAVGFGCNLGLSQYMKQGGTDYDIANARHLMSDAKSSVVVLATGLTAAALGETSWGTHVAFVVGAAVVICIIARDNYREARGIAQRLRQCVRSDAQ